MGNLFLNSRKSVARYFLDTEFIEDGRTIDLVSIGLVTEAGESYYGISTEADLTKASPWVREHVLPALPTYGDPRWKSRGGIRYEVEVFIATTSQSRHVEFWAYYADYDWVAFCQLFGTMIKLPIGFPRFCMDLKQLSELVGSPRHPPPPVDEHDALADARWNLDLFRFLRDYAERGEPPR
jgi:hypothetical protein